MESAADVRGSLVVVPLGDLHRHEATSPDGETRVAAVLAEAGVLSWPLVVDRASGLILDGSHRAVVLARDFGARFAVVQQVAFDSPEVRVGAWCRVLEGVSAAAFERACRMLGLEPGASEGFRCHYGGRAYAPPRSGGRESPDLGDALERLLWSNGHRPPVRLVEDDAVSSWLDAGGAVVLQPPTLDKATVRQRAAGALLPPKSTRFLLPFRVLGLGMPLAALGGPRDAIQAGLERDREQPLVCLGAGLVVDRRYPERLWQFAGHRIPDRLFADVSGRHAYMDSVARATVPAGQRDPRCQR
jgi:hypothetical protein